MAERARRIGTKEAYCKLVRLQLKYEIRAVGAVTYRTHRRDVCISALEDTSK